MVAASGEWTARLDGLGCAQQTRERSKVKSELLNSFRLDLATLRELIEPIPDSDMAVQPPGLNKHAAWTLGHLTHSMRAIGEELGIPNWLPADWGDRFGQGSTPSPTRDHYPSKSELAETFDDAASRIVARLEDMTPSEFDADLPDARHRERYPTIGHAAVHILASHFALHMGQLSCWRRAREIN